MKQKNHFEDEIDLVIIFKVLWKWRNLIIIGTLLTTFAAAGVSFLLPKVYEVTAMFEPGTRPITNDQGQIVDEEPVVMPESIKEVVIGGVYDEQIQKKLNMSPVEFPELKVSIPSKASFVRFAIESSKPQQAVAVLNELVTKISEGIQEKLEIEKKGVENEIELARINGRALDGKIRLIKKQVAETAGQIQDLEKKRQKLMEARSVDSMPVLLYSIELQNIKMYLNELQEKARNFETDAQKSGVGIDNLLLRLDAFESANINKEPSVSEDVVRPRKEIVVGLMFFVGLICMTVFAFLLEFVRRVDMSTESKTTEIISR